MCPVYSPEHQQDKTLYVNTSSVFRDWLMYRSSKKYLISLFLTSPRFFVFAQRILNYYPNYPTHRLYFGEVETPYMHHERATTKALESSEKIDDRTPTSANHEKQTMY